MIKVNLAYSGLKQNDLTNKKVLKALRSAHDNLHNLDRSSGTGWIELPNELTKQDLMNIKRTAKDIQDKAEVLVVLGIGGSYLGGYSAIKMLKRTPKTEVIYVGTNFSAYALSNTIESLKNKEVCLAVISKSGTTLETLVALNVFESFMKKKYKKKDEYKRRIYMITDYQNGYLRELCNKEGYASFVIPRTVGGRYSVLSPVGLLPMAVAGINIDKVLSGAKKMYNDCFNFDPLTNPAYTYAIARLLISQKFGKKIEALCCFDDRLKEFGEWYKQLFAESEGKNKKGIYPTSLNYSTDLHSFGQFVEQGTPLLFETYITIPTTENDFALEVGAESPITYLNGKTMSEINMSAEEGTIRSHIKANVPILKIELDCLTEETYGELVYFFETACATYCYMLGVNPFNQPGVEGYKTQMREILQKK